MKLGIIIGSNRPGRKGGKIGHWVAEVARSVDGVKVTVLDLAEINLPFLNEPKLPSQGDYQMEHTKRWSAVVAPLDAFIIVTPEYNHGYPAVLKNAIDTLYAEWQGKPVGFVGYGFAGGTRSIEQLIQVTTQLNMHTLGGQINLMVHAQQDQDGNFVPSQRDTGGVTQLVEKVKKVVK